MVNTALLCSARQAGWLELSSGRDGFIFCTDVREALSSPELGLFIITGPDREFVWEAARVLGEGAESAVTVAVEVFDQSTAAVAKATGLGSRMVGFIPGPSVGALKSVELLNGELTDSGRLALVGDTFRQLGLSVSVCRDQIGGILFRVVAATINEAAFLAESGLVSVEEVDRMMKGAANFPLGPLEWADRIGLDRVLSLLEALTRELGPGYRPCPWLRRKVEAGLIGVEAGRGFYTDYGQGAL